MLVGREGEKQELDRLLAMVREGLSGSIVLRGEAGIGKSALLEYAVASADDMQVASVAAVESEMELSFAGLHQLLVPFLSGLKRLPAPQREALGSAFGMIAAAAADLFLVGLAALTLIADAAAEQPVLCLVDDAQWLDQGSAGELGVVARRLLADRVGMLFTVREPVERLAAFEGLRDMQLGGLPVDQARELLASVAAGDVEELVGERLVSEARGNPLALIELGSELTAGHLAGDSRLPERLPLGRRLEARFLSRVHALPRETQTLLLLASAQQAGDPGHLWRAAEHLGVGRGAADPPELDRLITLEPRVAFRHPLMRSAVYRGSSAQERRRAHQALAAGADPEVDADRRAWHRAAAAVGPDEEVAGELELAAERARGRGGWSSGATFLERSAELTPDEHRRAERLLAAAQATLVAGEPARARELLEEATPRLVDPLARVQGRRLEGQICFGAGQMGESSSILLQAARASEALDVRFARDTLLEALEAAIFAGRLAGKTGALDIVRAAREAPLNAESEATIADLLLDGVTTYLEGRYREAFVLFRRAIGALCGGDDLRWFPLGCFAVGELLDDETQRLVTHRYVKLAPDQGALTSQAVALPFLGSAEARAGRFRSVDAIHAEEQEIAAAP